MTVLLARLVQLDPNTWLWLVPVLTVVGFVLGALLTPVQFVISRIGYVVFIVLNLVCSTLLMLGWQYLSPAADAGLFVPLALLLSVTPVATGLVAWIAGAARSNDMRSDTRRAWLTILPFAPLVLVFSRTGPQSPRLNGREAVDVDAIGYDAGTVTVLIAAFAGFTIVRGMQDVVEDRLASPTPTSAALNAILSQATTVADSFASEAKLTAPLLPVWISEGIRMTSINAFGDRLTMTYTSDADITLNTDARRVIASDVCRQDMFAYDLFKGGQIRHRYLDSAFKLIMTFDITADDCAT